MPEKKKDIYTEIEELTKDNPNNYLISSLTGQVSLRGKFVRDENGKLKPVLLNINQHQPLPQTEWGTITDVTNGPKKEPAPWYRRWLKIFSKETAPETQRDEL